MTCVVGLGLTVLLARIRSATLAQSDANQIKDILEPS